MVYSSLGRISILASEKQEVKWRRSQVKGEVCHGVRETNAT